MVPFKLRASCEDKIEYGTESLMDRIAYFFTSDKSVSEKIGNLLYHLEKLDEDQIKALESTHIDFKMQTFANVQKIMSFSNQAVDYVVANTRKYENKSYALLENERDELRQEIDSAYSSFISSHNKDEITGLLSGKGIVADKTYAALGFTHQNLITVAKEFKDNQSGRLPKLKKMKFISNVLAVTPKNFQLKVIHEASYKFAALLGTAIDSYKYVDRFLFYTYRRLQKQKVIPNN